MHGLPQLEKLQDGGLKMRIELEIAKDDKEWNELIKKSPHGSIFHTWKWLKISEKYTNTKLYPIIGYKGEEPIGIFPIFYKKKYFIRMAFSPPPHTGVTYLGLLLINYNKLKESKRLSYLIEFHKFVDEFICKELNCNYILITTPPNFIDARPFKWTNYTLDPIYNYRIYLSVGLDKVWENFKPELRSHIKRTNKRGVKVEFGDINDLKFIYESLVWRYKEQGRSIKVKFDYLKEIYENYKKYMKIFISKFNDEPIGGIVVTAFNGVVSYWIGGAKAKLKGLSPNDLAQWEAIKWAYENGFKYYEEIGAGTENLSHFKAKYNPELTICFTAKKSSALSSLIEKIYMKMKK